MDHLETMDTLTTHHHLAALARVAQTPRLTPRGVALLHTLGGRIWRAHRADAPMDWIWAFQHNGADGYTSDDGWDAREVLRTFAILDPVINVEGELTPGFYGFRTPILTSKAVHAVSGVRMAGTWINGTPGQTGFLFGGKG
jgi:hypothetical protein